MNISAVIKKLILWIPKNIGGILGVAQAIAKAIREIAIVLVRIVCPILSFGEDGKTDDRIIKKIADFADWVDKGIEVIKNKLLMVGDSNSNTV